MANKSESSKSCEELCSKHASVDGVQAESGIEFNSFRPKPAFSKEKPDGRLPYA